MRLIRLLLAVSLFAPPAVAQVRDTLTVGDLRIMTTRVTRGADTLLILMEDRGREVAVGTVVLETRVATRDGRALIERTERMTVHGEVIAEDRWSIDRWSLAPVFYSHRSAQDTTVMEFTDDGFRMPPGRLKFRLPRPPFLAASMDLLLASLEENEQRVVVPTFDHEYGPAWATIHVARKDEVEADGEIVRARRYEVASDAAGGTYWLDDAGRLVVFHAPGRLRLVRRSAGRAPVPTRTRTSP